MLRFKFPEPDILSLRLASPTSPILTLSNCAVGWNMMPVGGTEGTVAATGVTPTTGSVVLNSITLQLTMRSRVALVGPNGQGKSTLIEALKRAFNGDIIFVDTAPDTTTSSVTKKKSSGLSLPKSKSKAIVSAKSSGAATKVTSPVAPTAAAVAIVDVDAVIGTDVVSQVFIRGEVTRNHNIRTATVSQHHFDSIAEYLNNNAVEYMRAMMTLLSRSTSHPQIGSTTSASTAMPTSMGSDGESIESKLSETEIRAHLGMFGLGGDVALRTLGSLSGGQKARLAFAAACITRPHVLFLDEVCIKIELI